MRRRPGMTLLEVLISIFIMALGMLALLTLFPLGALSMARALQDDRAAAAANLAAEYAEATGLREDANVTPAFAAPPPGYAGPLPGPSAPSWPVFVDAYGAAAGLGPLGAAPGTPGVARVRPSYAPTLPLTARWFSLPDDLAFAADATPAGGVVRRGGRYTWAYLLRRPLAADPAAVDLSVVVYAGRDAELGGETPYAAGGSQGGSSLTLTYTSAQGKPALRRGGWVLDVTFDPARRVTQANFYRIVSVEDVNAQTLLLEVDGTLEADVDTVVVMDNVAEVLKMGTGRVP